ncbi:Na+/H+ antiporter subunit E [Archangium sp.]|uniref:Na+/H+ antiporter subunit E n=1 Tax=Archangium sp. TaxID=1872627 RepID=UPI002D2AE6F3|nr:Na+/H+ antiporter subunit E [Archangium sp.]HYO53879.1 Na+/H+ antiporter subunit E [Archangium sp.]
MRTLLGNLALAVGWAAITHFSVANLLVGFVLGYLILWASPSVAQRNTYFLRGRQLAGFALFFLQDLVRSTLRISHDVLTPAHRMTPAVLAIPLDARTDGEITFLALVVSLSPGTLALDVSSDRRVLYIHAMYAADPEAVRRGIKQGFERRILELLR